MKVSLNSIRSFNERYRCADDVTAIGVDQLVEKIGAQLGAVDEVIRLGSKYDPIVIVKVVSCEKHNDADKLNVCLIDDGGMVPDVERDADGRVQVVCGAPNVHPGMLAAWLPPGSTVPETADKDPFVLDARAIRGVVSNGMLASPKELALGDSHEGILEIAGDYRPGTSFTDTFQLKDDIILDIENKMFTHRPDCFGLLGIARELAGIQGMPYKSPDWYALNPQIPGPEAEELKLEFRNELSNLVKRFAAITMRDVKVGPSPVWLQVELAKLGQKSINNIVDYTNFFMLETGQPLHAYDYDKVKALSGGEASIVVRNPKPGEKVKLLNGKEIEPRAEAIMIATDQQLIGVGGVMGGSETEVDENTKNIIIECASFDMYSVRRTVMEHGLFTDAATRFTKGQSPLQNLAVLAKIVDEIRQATGAKVAGPVLDDNHVGQPVMERGSLHVPINIAADFINVRLGLQLSAEEIKRLLENVEFKVEIKDEALSVTAPFWRTDIDLREDIVEEVGRLYGYDKLPLDLQERTVTPTHKDPMLSFKAAVRASLSQAGANEVLTYSFVHGDLLDKVGQDKTQAYQLSNALSPELQYYRLSLTPSILDKVHSNVKAGYDGFALFEIGKCHIVDQLEDDVPVEFERVALVVAAGKKAASAFAGAPYYEARKYLIYLLESLGVEGEITFETLNPDDPDLATTYYEPGRAATVKLDGQLLGRIGEYKTSVRNALKLPPFCAGFELGLVPLLKAEKGIQYRPLPRFPKITQDMTLQVASDLAFGELFSFVSEEVAKIQPDSSLPELSTIDIYQKEGESNKRITLRLSIASYERTLTDPEVNKLLDNVAEAAKAKYGAERM